MRRGWAYMVSCGVLLWLSGCGGEMLRLDMAEYQDKVYAAWLGQCIGNMYGLAHEFQYNSEPRTDPIEGWADGSLARIREANGAFSDDDTDIEYTMLFCMEKHGVEPTYENLTEFWMLCINRYIWVANRSARDLMDKGYLPPLTGRRGLNVNWFQIDPQLVCEIWAVTAPGMLDYAAAKADWAAKVTNDAEGTHPTIWYNTMYSAAFFETDVERLCQLGYEHVPAGSLFREAIDDVRRWKADHGEDWVAVRRKIKEKYHDGRGLADGVPHGGLAAILNGSLGVLALLYGEGDFEKTMNMACMAGYDADNQCATLAGLVGIMHGSGAIPRKYTHVLGDWTLPLNDFYKNRTRDRLPDGKLTEMGMRTANLGRELVESNGGRVKGKGEDAVLLINPRAPFRAPLEVRLMPVYLDVHKPVTVRPIVIGERKTGRARITVEGSLPPGLGVERENGRSVLSGAPTQTGEYELRVTVVEGRRRRETKLKLFVREPNLALSADRVLAAVEKPTGIGSKDLNVLRDGLTREHYDSYDGENELDADFYGYAWKQPVQLSKVVFHGGRVFPNGGWFESLQLQYRDELGHWQPLEDVKIEPAFSAELARKGEQVFVLTFRPIQTLGIRVVGTPGGDARFTSVQELEVFAE